MDWYWLISNNNDNLLNELLKEIEQDGIKPLGDWRAVYNKGYDGYLVNMVYNIIANDKLSSKDEIAVELYNLLKPLYASVGAITKEDFNNIVDNIWCRVFEVNGQKYFIKTLAKKNQPFWKKIMSNNTFLILFGVAMICLGYNISEMIYMPEIERFDEYGNLERGNGESMFVSITLVIMSVMGVGSVPEKTRTYLWSLYTPLIIAIGVSVYHILLSSYEISGEAFEAVQICKRWMVVAVLQALWIPIWWINHERMTEKKADWEDMYRNHNNVK